MSLKCALVQSVCPGTNLVVVEETVSWFKGFVRGLWCLPSIVEIPNTLKDLVLGLPGRFEVAAIFVAIWFI